MYFFFFFCFVLPYSLIIIIIVKFTPFLQEEQNNVVNVFFSSYHPTHPHGKEVLLPMCVCVCASHMQRLCGYPFFVTAA